MAGPRVAPRAQGRPQADDVFAFLETEEQPKAPVDQALIKRVADVVRELRNLDADSDGARVVSRLQKITKIFESVIILGSPYPGAEHQAATGDGAAAAGRNADRPLIPVPLAGGPLTTAASINQLALIIVMAGETPLSIYDVNPLMPYATLEAMGIPKGLPPEQVASRRAKKPRRLRDAFSLPLESFRRAASSRRTSSRAAFFHGPCRAASSRAGPLPRRRPLAGPLPRRRPLAGPLPRRRPLAGPLPGRSLLVGPLPRRRPLADFFPGGIFSPDLFLGGFLSPGLFPGVLFTPDLFRGGILSPNLFPSDLAAAL